MKSACCKWQLSPNREEVEQEVERSQTGMHFIMSAFQLKVTGKQFWWLRWNWNLVWRMRKCWLTGEYIQQRNRRGGRQSRSLSVCRMCIFTFTQLCEDQELGLSGVRLLLTDGSSGAELNHVGVTRQLFLYSEQVKEHAAKTLLWCQAWPQVSGSIFQPHWND